MKTLFVYVWCCAALSAAVSVDLPQAKTATVTHPAISASESFRIEGRIHNRTAVMPGAGNAMALVFGSGQNGFAVSMLSGPMDRVSCFVQNNPTTSTAVPPTDFEFRVQRVITGVGTATRTCEVWDIGAVGSPLVLNSSSAVTPTSIASGTLTVGGTYSDFAFAYVRWFSTTVATGGLPPGASTTVGNVINYNFEGATAAELGADTSGNARNLTWSGGTAPATLTTPTYSPVCDLGESQRFRAGETVTISGAASWSRNAVPLSYQWNLISVPGDPTVVDNDTSSESISLQNTVFGQHTIGLTVTDTGGSTSCTVDHGVVAYTTEGIVIYPPGTPSAMQTLIGPLMVDGLNPLGWLDFALKSAADTFDARWGTFDGYVDRRGYWDDDPENWATGTVNIKQSDTSLTVNDDLGVARNPGVLVNCTTPGTCLFRSTVCNASGVIAAGNVTGIFIRYPVYQGGYVTSQGGWVSGVPIGTGETGWLKAFVLSCPSDDQVLLSAAVNIGAPKSTAINTQPWSYFVRPTAGVTNPIQAWSAAAPTAVDFYDSALGYYGMYYRTGLTKYLTRARYITDRHYGNATNMNKGLPYRIGIDCGPGATAATTCLYAEGDGQDPRDGNFISVMVRALDGKPEYWTGLRRVCGYYEDAGYARGAGDREHGYALLFISGCALADPNPTFKARWLAELNLDIAGFAATVCTEANETSGNERPCHGRWLGQWVLPTSNTAPGPFGLGSINIAGQTKTNWKVRMTNGSSIATMLNGDLTTPTTNALLKPVTELVEVPVSFGPDQTLGALCVASGAVGSMTCSTTPPTGSYTDGLVIVLRPPTTITGAIAPFINVNGLGTKAITNYYPSNTTLWTANSYLTAGMDWAIRYSGALGKFVQVPILSIFYPITEPSFGFAVTSDLAKAFIWPERLSSSTFRMKEYSLNANRAAVANYTWNNCNPGPTCDLDFRWDFAVNLGGRVQPFMQSIILLGLDTAYEATVAAGAPDSRLPPLISNAAKWLVDYGYDPLTGGLAFARNGVGCEAASAYGVMPATITLDSLGSFTPLTSCLSDSGGARAMSAETPRAMSKAYVRESDAGRKTAIRNWMYKVMGRAYGKDPSTYACTGGYAAWCGDGYYFVALEETFGGGISTEYDKYLGFAIGMGGAMTWEAAAQHTSWPRVPTTKTVKISFRLADIPTATGVRITLKDQHGTTQTPVDCAVSPCSVSVPDVASADYQLQIEYRAGGLTLSQGQWQRLKNRN